MGIKAGTLTYWTLRLIKFNYTIVRIVLFHPLPYNLLLPVTKEETLKVKQQGYAVGEGKLSCHGGRGEVG